MPKLKAIRPEGYYILLETDADKEAIKDTGIAKMITQNSLEVSTNSVGPIEDETLARQLQRLINGKANKIADQALRQHFRHRR